MGAKCLGKNPETIDLRDDHGIDGKSNGNGNSILNSHSGNMKA